jgi:hypothetical protein
LGTCQGLLLISREICVVIARIIAAVGIVAMSVAVPADAGQASPGTLSEIRTFELTEGRTKAAGEQRPIDNPSLQYGEELHVYVEPELFGWHGRNGAARFGVVVDAELRRRDGRIVAGGPDPRTLNKEAPARPDDFFLSFSLTIRLPVGAYRLVIRLRDTVTGQVAEKSFPFAMVSHRSAPPAAHEPKSSRPAKSVSERTDCKKYFPQVGQMIAVPCQR